MNNIYAKTVFKEYSTPHELHPITSTRGLEGGWKVLQRVRGGAPEALAHFHLQKGAFVTLLIW